MTMVGLIVLFLLLWPKFKYSVSQDFFIYFYLRQSKPILISTQQNLEQRLKSLYFIFEESSPWYVILCTYQNSIAPSCENNTSTIMMRLMIRWPDNIHIVPTMLLIVPLRIVWPVTAVYVTSSVQESAMIWRASILLLFYEYSGILFV